MSLLDEFRIYMKGSLASNIDVKVKTEERDYFKNLNGLRVFKVYVPAGMAEFWRGFWDEGTEAKMRIWEDMAQTIPHFGRDGAVSFYRGLYKYAW
jgi:hypothetical protein